MKTTQLFSLTIGSLRWLVLPLLCLFANRAEAEIVTLVLGRNGTTLPATNKLEIKAGQVAKVISWPAVLNGYSTYLKISKEGYAAEKARVDFSLSSDPVIIVGPATFDFYTLNPETSQGFMTMEIAPESFPPDKTIIIPEGTGARVALECSTNLLEWAEVWSASYTNVPSNKFFRIKADRVP